jgi:hypothetical protein
MQNWQKRKDKYADFAVVVKVVRIIWSTAVNKLTLGVGNLC